MKTSAQVWQTEGTSALKVDNPRSSLHACRMIESSSILAGSSYRNGRAPELNLTRFEKPARKKPTQVEVFVAFAVSCLISFGSLFIFY